MKTAGADVPTNPNEFIRNLGSTTVDIVLESLKDGQISLSQWKKTELTKWKKENGHCGKDDGERGIHHLDKRSNM